MIFGSKFASCSTAIKSLKKMEANYSCCSVDIQLDSAYFPYHPGRLEEANKYSLMAEKCRSVSAILEKRKEGLLLEPSERHEAILTLRELIRERRSITDGFRG